MTEKEIFMYEILAEISNADIPIVFKGGLITKLILQEKNFTSTIRHTKDIDANWTGVPPTMETLVETIQKSLGKFQGDFIVTAERNYSDGKSAGLTIYKRNPNDENEKIITIDMDIKPVSNSRSYFLGTANIHGVLANDILADKISVLSTDRIYKNRAKDIIDVYCLAHCCRVDLKNIYEICNTSNHRIYDFEAFYNKKNNIEYAYNKLKGIEGKPLFSEVYDYLSKFIKPFAERTTLDITWDCQSSSWRTETLQQTKKLGKNPVLKIAEYQRKHREPSIPTVIKDNIKKKKNSLE